MRRALAIFVLLVPVAGAHDVITTKITWSKEISRLLYKRCAVCHGEGSSIPLMTYDQARPWAVDIKDEVLTRQMPPWQAVKGFGAFKDDRGMTQEEMEYISDWVTGGAPEGNPKMLPKKSDPQQWRDPDSPAGSLEVDVAGGVKLGDSRQVLAVRPKGLAKGASVQVVAARPDGSFEPLLWIFDFNPDFARTYYYVAPLSLPAGTEIEMNPPDAGKIALFTKAGGKAAKSGTGLH